MRLMILVRILDPYMGSALIGLLIAFPDLIVFVNLMSNVQCQIPNSQYLFLLALGYLAFGIGSIK